MQVYGGTRTSKSGKKQTACMSRQAVAHSDHRQFNGRRHEGLRAGESAVDRASIVLCLFLCRQSSSQWAQVSVCDSENAHPPTLHPDLVSAWLPWKSRLSVSMLDLDFARIFLRTHTPSPATLTPPLTAYRPAARRRLGTVELGHPAPLRATADAASRIRPPRADPSRLRPLRLAARVSPGKSPSRPVCRPSGTSSFLWATCATSHRLFAGECAALDGLPRAHVRVGEALGPVFGVAPRDPRHGVAAAVGTEYHVPLPLRISTSLITEDPPSRSIAEACWRRPTPRRA